VNGVQYWPICTSLFRRLVSSTHQSISVKIRLLAIIVAVTGLIAPLRAQQLPSRKDVKPVAKPEPKKPFRDNTTLPHNRSLEKRFGTVKDLLAENKWNEAVGILQEISQTENRSLVEVQRGESGGVATYLNVSTRCNVLLATRLSPEGRALYRSKVDPQARRWFENWQRTRDEAELLRIVRQTFMSSYGDDALLALGEAAWDRGDFSAARQWWQQLLPIGNEHGAITDAEIAAEYSTILRYPDAQVEASVILARIIMCSIMDREFIGAQDELREFAERFPLAEGTLGGVTGVLIELLKANLEAARTWVNEESPAEVATFGLSPARYQRIPESVDMGTLRWSRPLSPNLLPRPTDTQSQQNDMLSYFPVVYDKLVFVNDADSIRAWNILTGDVAWQSDRRDPSVIYPPVADEQITVPDKPCVGVPYYTMTIADGRLYARMGSAVTCSSTTELRRELVSDLVCLDLTKEGKLIWKFSSHELFPDEHAWRFEGTPVVVDGRAYLAVCRRHPQLELMIACLDAFDGRLLWQRPIGAFRSTVDESNNRVSHLLLTVGGGRVFLSTDAGAIVAVDAHDGRLEWAVVYESRTNETPASQGDPKRKGLLPPLFHNGRLIVAPNDANSAFCIEADSGRLRWQLPYQRNVPKLADMVRQGRGTKPNDRQWRHLLGVVPGGTSGRLIASGDSLCSVDIETGDIVWERTEGTLIQANRQSFGHGLIAGEQVILPTRESVEIFDAQSGDHLRRVLLKSSDPLQRGGNLVVAAGMLLVAQSTQLSAYCEYSQLKKRIENDLTRHPDDLRLQIQLADLAVIEHQPDVAEKEFRTVLEKVDRTDPSYFIVRRKLTRLLCDAAAAKVRDDHFEEARDVWLRALPIADDITKRIEIIFDLARVEESLDRPGEAVERLQDVLNNSRLGSIRRDSLTARHEAVREIARIISRHGRAVYDSVDAAASAELEALTESADRRGLKHLLDKYPHARLTDEVRKRLIELHRSAGEISEAHGLLDEIRRSAHDEQTFVESTLEMIRLLQTAGLNQSATQLWQSLASLKSTFEVRVADRSIDLQTLATTQLQSRPTKPVVPNFFERTWSCKLDSEAQVVVPSNDAPSAELASVMICERHPTQSNSWIWRCVDWSTGRQRWEEIASGPIHIAAWTPVHLIVGTPHGWSARVPATGRVVWDQISFFETTPLLAGGPHGDRDSTVWPASFSVDRGLRLFNSNDGNVVAEIVPEGRLHRIIGTSREQTGSVSDAASDHQNDDGSFGASSRCIDRSLTVLMQTIKPTRTLVASVSLIRNEWFITELARGGEPWQSVPIVADGCVVGVTADHHLVGYGSIGREPPEENASTVDAYENLGRWAKRQLAIGQAPPAVYPQSRGVLVAVDGSQLALVDARTGARMWSQGIADYPLRAADRQICVADGRAFAASQGLLRCISAEDGAVLFEQYLGDTAAQWQVSPVWSPPSDNTSSEKPPIGLLAAWPLNSARKVSSLWICDAQTGAIRQQIRLDAAPREIAINYDGCGVVRTDRSLTGLRFSTVGLPPASAARSSIAYPK